MRPGFTTATQYSGAPFPLPMRVSAGFFVTGLSGKIRIHTLPPRFTKRVIAIRPASICRSVIQAGSSVFKPKSPNSSDEPRQALPFMRPRCCLRYFTFFGINMVQVLLDARRGRPLGLPARQNFTFIDPALHADDSIGGVRLSESVVDICAQCVQRQTALQVPLGAGDFRAVQTPADADLDSFRAKPEGRIHRLSHRPAECNSFL